MMLKFGGAYSGSELPFYLLHSNPAYKLPEDVQAFINEFVTMNPEVMIWDFWPIFKEKYPQESEILTKADKAFSAALNLYTNSANRDPYRLALPRFDSGEFSGLSGHLRELYSKDNALIMRLSGEGYFADFFRYVKFPNPDKKAIDYLTEWALKRYEQALELFKEQAKKSNDPDVIIKSVEIMLGTLEMTAHYWTLSSFVGQIGILMSELNKLKSELQGNSLFSTTSLSLPSRN